ncbi:MAG TPA: DNA gyrase subunit A [Actinocatenispora sp.]
MTETTVPPGGGDRIEPVGLEVEMQRSYLDYAMSVIVGRALPEVRDGLKPVHRKILYGMYDDGVRPERGYVKCAKVVGAVMGNYHPHGDSAIYDSLVRLAQPWSMRYPLIDGNGNFGSPGNDPAAAMRYTECRLDPLAMEMLRDIDEDTVDFSPNYDGTTREPDVLPARFPNLLVNGSEGIAVGMATRIPPHNLREVAAGVQWCLDHPEATEEEALEELIGIVKGPDFPTKGVIVGGQGIIDAYRTGRGSIRMRAVIDAEEDAKGRTILVVTELPYQVNPDTLAQKIAEGVKDGKLAGIADIRDETSGRTGQRLVIVLKRDAIAKVVLNNLYKHTQLQTTFGANMLALVDGVPRTLPVDAFIRHWVDHQIDVIVRRTTYRLRKAEERIHILRALLKALDQLDEVIALIRRSPSAEVARGALIELLEIDEIQARAILDMQLRQLAALERQKTIDEHDEWQRKIEDYQDILAKPDRQRSIVSEELAEIVDKYGDERRTTIDFYDGDMSMEDLIPEEDVVVTITRGGYAKRTRVDAYRSQGRGGKGVRGASLRGDDEVAHFFTTSSHNWLLFFTNLGRVYRAKAYELPDAARDGKGQHVANLLAFQPDEQIAQVLDLRDYNAAPYLVLATRNGLVKKTRLGDYDSPRSGGLIAVNLKDGDELIGADLLSAEDDLLLVSRKGMSVRFHATDDQLRPMGRATSGVTGMRFRGDDSVLSMSVIREGEDPDVFVVFENGMAKRSPASDWNAKGRGILGVAVAKMTERNGDLVGALTVDEDDEVLVIFAKGNIVRMPVGPVTRRGRNTQGMRFANPGRDDSVVAVARNPESMTDVADEGGEGDSSHPDAVPSTENAHAVDGEGAAGATPQAPAPESATDDSSGGSE